MKVDWLTAHVDVYGSIPLRLQYLLHAITILRDIFALSFFKKMTSGRPIPTNKSLMLTYIDAAKAVPLTCHGHSRPVTHLSFSSIVEDGQYYIISACKG